MREIVLLGLIGLVILTIISIYNGTFPQVVQTLSGRKK